jgi:hypothetical protein
LSLDWAICQSGHSACRQRPRQIDLMRQSIGLAAVA